MWNGFCGELIRKTSQRLMIVGIVILAGLAIFFALNRSYFLGFFSGPHAATQNELLAAKDATAFSNSILKVEGATAGTGLYETTTDRSHPEGYTSARYLVTEIGGKRLLVRVSPDDPLAQDTVDPSLAGTVRAQPSMTFTGNAAALTPKMREQLSTATALGDEQYLPYYLDVYDYKTFGWTSSIIGGLLLLGAGWAIQSSLSRKSDPAKDSLSKGLVKYGPLETVVPQVDAEMAGAHTVVSRRSNTIHVSPTWMIASTPFRAYGSRLDGLVWVYRLIVKRRMYFVIPAGTRHTLVAYDRYGQKMTVQLDEAKTSEVIQFLRSTAPQAIYGYDRRLVRLWSANKTTDKIGFVAQAQALLAGMPIPEAIVRKQYNAG